ncbi:MAG: CHAD domain-containing protein [Bacteroidota bacterium]|nr:CHAD domain-containing protein [Bacteroidota bacterium]
MTLTPEQRSALENLLADDAATGDNRRNARLLLLYADGKETDEIAEVVGLSPSRTRYWRRTFERAGMTMFERDFVPPRRAGTSSTPQETAPLLTTAQLQELRSRRTQEADVERIRRMDILLSYAAGKGTVEIARAVGLSPSRTRYWRKAFQRDGMSILDPAGSGAAPAGKTAGPKRKALPGMRPQDSLAEAGRKVLRLHFEEMMHQGGSNALGEDPEIVHKMRVATRRMRSAFQVFDGAFTEKTVKQFRKPLKRIGRILGRVRDLDVLLIHMRDYADELPAAEATAFQPLMNAWEEERQVHIAALRAYLQSDAYTVFCAQFRSFVETSGKGAAAEQEVLPGLPKRIGQIAPVLVMERYTDVLAFDTDLETATLDRLHALRIQCKKLRYTVEFLQELLGPQSKKVIRHVTDLQDYLGHLQDDQTAGQMITAFVQELDDRQAHLTLGERLNAAPLLTYLADRQARKHRLLTDFPQAWQLFLAEDFRRRLLQSLLHLGSRPEAAAPGTRASA